MKYKQIMMRVTLCNGKTFVVPDSKENRNYWLKQCSKAVFEPASKELKGVKELEEIEPIISEQQELQETEFKQQEQQETESAQTENAPRRGRPPKNNNL